MRHIFFTLIVSCLVMGGSPVAAADGQDMDSATTFIRKEAVPGELPVRPGRAFAKRVGYYIGDQMVGERLYYANDKVMSEIVMSEAGRDGLCRSWHVNGQLKTLAPYRLGKLDGTAKQWSADGKLVGSFQMISGTGLEFVWNENGTLFSVTSYVDGKRAGLLIKYYADGAPSTVESYRNDVLDGPEIKFYPSRAVHQSATYRNGFVAGPFLILDETGHAISGTPTWSLNGSEMPRADYEKARAEDQSLPSEEPVFPKPPTSK